MSIEKFEGGLAVRPMSGLPGFKRNACVQLKDGTISATNRWGKSRSFPLSGAENSPKQAGGAFNPGMNVWWLEDEKAKLLLVVDLEHFWPVEMDELVQNANLPERDSGLSDRMFPMRPDVFKVSDLQVVNFGISCAGIGGSALALRWLGVLPEWIMLAVALPAAIAAVLCIVLNKATGPKGEDKAHVDYLLTHQDELFAAADEDFDNYDPDHAHEVKTDPGTPEISPPEQVDGG
jgi:hypothetical protein